MQFPFIVGARLFIVLPDESTTGNTDEVEKKDESFSFEMVVQMAMNVNGATLM